MTASPEPRRITTTRLTTIPFLTIAALLVTPSAAIAATTTPSGFTVSTPGKTSITVRSAPDSTASAVGHLANGSKLMITCQTKGGKVHDTTSNHSSSLWDKLSTGGYVSNLYTTAYRATGAGYTPGLKACAATTTRTPKSTAKSASTPAIKSATKTSTKTSTKAAASTKTTQKSGVTANLLPTPVGAASPVTTTAP